VRSESNAQAPFDVKKHDVLSAKEVIMGKYFLAWLLGVPAGLLVIIYLIMHM
jgi:hypothetical protein